MVKLPEKLYDVIKQLPYDLRAEVVLADLIERGLNRDVLLVSSKGLFKRRFSRDIEQVSNIDTGRRGKFTVAEVNREGIYDTLPQAITHSVKHSKNPGMKTSGEMVSEVKERRAEEQAARQFFLPFENEFHQQCIELEIAERNILKGFMSNSKYTMLMNEFWQLPSILDERQKAAFIYLIPIIYKAAGDLNLTRLCYEAILNVKVSIAIKNGLEQTDNLPVMPLNTNFILGTNFVCGNRFNSYSRFYEILIGPLNEVQLQDYLPGKSGRALVEFLNGYYLPFETDNKLLIQTEPDINEFMLNSPATRLAYSTCI